MEIEKATAATATATATDDLSSNLSTVKPEYDSSTFHSTTPLNPEHIQSSIEPELHEIGCNNGSIEDNSNNQKDSSKPLKITVAKVLVFVKFLGAATVATAMGLFLFEGLEVAGDIQRFSSIAGFGALMTALGLAVYYGLKDRVASRLFLGLSLASVPLVSSVLGGLIFSLTDAAKQLTIPSIITWTLPNTASLYFALPLGLLTIAGIAAFGFMVLARSEWRWMTPTLLITNAFIILPNRSTLAATLFALISISTIFWLIKNKTNNQASLKTLEGLWALGILFIAPLISVGRTALLYDHNLLMMASVAILLFIGARYWLKSCEAGTKSSVVAAILSFVCAAFAISHGVEWAVKAAPNLFQRGAILHEGAGVIAAALMLAIQLDVTRKNPEHFISKIQSVFTCFGASVWFALGIDNAGGLITCIIALAAPTLFSVLHWRRGNRVAAGLLVICLVWLLALTGEDLLTFISHSGWSGLAAAGSAIIIGGAALERTLSKSQRVSEAGA